MLSSFEDGEFRKSEDQIKCKNCGGEAFDIFATEATVHGECLNCQEYKWLIYSKPAITPSPIPEKWYNKEMLGANTLQFVESRKEYQRDKPW